MAQCKTQYMQKEVYILSRPSKLQPVTDYSIATQCTHREKDQELPQLPSTLEAQERYQCTLSSRTIGKESVPIQAYNTNISPT